MKIFGEEMPRADDNSHDDTGITLQVDSLSCTPLPDGLGVNVLREMLDPRVNARETAQRCAKFLEKVFEPVVEGSNSRLGVSLQPGLLTPLSVLQSTLSGDTVNSYDIPYTYSTLMGVKPIHTIRHLLKPTEVLFAAHQHLTFAGFEKDVSTLVRTGRNPNIFRLCSEAIHTGQIDNILHTLLPHFKGAVIAIEPNGGLHTFSEWIGLVSNLRCTYRDMFNIGLSFDAAHLAEAAQRGQRINAQELQAELLGNSDVVLQAGVPVHAVEVNLVTIDPNGKVITHAPFTNDKDQGPIGPVYPYITEKLLRNNRGGLTIVVETHPGQYKDIVFGELRCATISYLKDIVGNQN